MITFQNNGFTITVTDACPIEGWLELQRQLYDLLRTINEENMPPRIDAVMNLLEELQPEWEVARRMIATAESAGAKA